MVTLTSGEDQNRFGQLLDTARRETVAITRHGRILISPQAMTELLTSQSRRSKAINEEWSQRTAKHATPAALPLTDDEINWIVHDVR